MKKILMIAAMAVSTLCASAQNQKGDIAVELQFNPFSTNYTTFKGGDYTLSGKYFITDKQAIRVGLTLGYDSESNNTDNGKTPTVTTTDKSSMTFGIAGGFEHYLVNKEKFALYVGGQIGLDLNTYSAESETTYYKMNGDDRNGVDKTTKTEYSGWDGKTHNNVAISLGGVLGANYNITDNIYVGTELGLRLKSTSYTEGETKSDNLTVKDGYDVSKTSFGFYVQPALRLGLKF